MGMQEVELFLNSVRSEITRSSYHVYLKKYMEYMGLTDLLSETNPRLIEQQIIKFIIDMKQQNKSHSAIQNYTNAILAFYKINDVVLNTTKISKFMPEDKRVKKDRAYEHQEISKLLEIAEDRFKVIILLMASSGIRVGSVPALKLRNLDDNKTKLTVYEGTREEYFTFITPECKKAIDNYIDMRARYGEKINDDSYLIREQFNTRLKGAAPRPIKTITILTKLIEMSVRCGIRNQGIRVPIAHGFRKFFTTQLINSKLNPEIREMLLGHKIGLASAYYRPTEQEMYNEYMKAVNLLTINEENRLKIKVQLLEGEKNEITSLKKQVNDNASMLNDVLDLIKLKLQNDSTISGTKEYQQQKDRINSIDKRLAGKGIKI
jgi:integrase